MDYEWETTLWSDFTIADKFGKAAIQDTFDRVMLEWKHNIVFMAELALATNWKSWQWYDEGNEEISKLYADLYYKVDDYVYDEESGFSEEELNQYFRITD